MSQPPSAIEEGMLVMIDAQNFSMPETLKNGTPVTIRAVCPEDKRGIAEAFGNLDPESIYTRFFRHKNELTVDELKAATEVDFENTVALVVVVPEGEGQETIIGAGRYVSYAPPNAERSAEVAFTVEEDYQGQGIAGMILRHLIHIAREQGVAQFEAEVLPKNRAMLAVLARSGLPMKQSFEDNVVHAILSLTADTPSTTGEDVAL
jgi:RimJ/RimL family protein N-acetyltransferase